MPTVDSKDTSWCCPGMWIALIVLTVTVRGAILLGMPGALADDPDAYRRLAENLLAHQTLGDGVVPSAYRPPLYPLLLAGCLTLDHWTLGDFGAVAIGILHLALGVATVLWTCFLGRRWGLGNLAFAAGVLVACDPILLKQSTLVMTETLATFLAVGTLWWLTSTAERPGVSRALVAGAWLALAALCRPTFLVFLAVVSLVLLLLERDAARRLKTTAAFTLAAVVVLTPWIARNRVQLGRLVVATTHGGYTLLLGNNRWFYEYLRTGDWGTIWNADAFTADWSAQLAHGGPADELANDRLAYAEARRSIAQEPGMFLYASVVRVGRLWAPVPHKIGDAESRARHGFRYAIGAWYLTEFALAVLGLAAIGAREGTAPLFNRTWLWGVLLVFCFMAVHTFYWTNMRMRAPLMPVVALAAAGGVAWITGRRAWFKLGFRIRNDPPGCPRAFLAVWPSLFYRGTRLTRTSHQPGHSWTVAPW